MCARFSLSASDGFAQVKGDPEEVFSASLSSFVIVWSRVVIITGISLLHIWKGYHTEVLKDVTAELPSTGLVLLTGPSGCGKTTLSHLILGLIKPDRGEIKGTEGLRFSAVFQENRLFPGFTVADNINAPLKQKLTDSEMDELLNKLGLSGIAQQYPNELSGGMQRRVAFARALAFDGDLFGLDEPFAGLDDHAKSLVIRQIISLCQNKLVILIVHHSAEFDDLPHRAISLAPSALSQ